MEKVKQAIELLKQIENPSNVYYWIDSKVLNLNDTEKAFVLDYFKVLFR